MFATDTTELFGIQPGCSFIRRKSFVSRHAMTDEPLDAGEAGRWIKAQREARGMSAKDLANRISGLAREAGDPTVLSQQNLSKFEQGAGKKKPAWVRFAAQALRDSDGETKEDAYLSTGPVDDSIAIKLLPTFVGLGDGGTGEGDFGVVSFSKALIEGELKAPAEALLAMVAEGHSMEPDFRGGDQILVDTRRKSLAQPGAFCIWDGDGHVVKFIEKVPDTDPQMVRLVSANSIYEPRVRLLDEINLVGRVVWFGRRVQ